MKKEHIINIIRVHDAIYDLEERMEKALLISISEDSIFEQTNSFITEIMTDIYREATGIDIDDEAWAILNAPCSAEERAELIMEGKKYDTHRT